ncbi:hypothetical protein ABIE40_005917 [Rhizobium sp. OAE497]
MRTLFHDAGAKVIFENIFSVSNATDVPIGLLANVQWVEPGGKWWD